MLIIFAFLFVHWQASVFFQSFFLHRYGAHRQFTMSKRWEKIFHFLTWLVQGASYLSPRAYAYLHRAHHAYSDTEKDPHSPMHHPFGRMMWRTNLLYRALKSGAVKPEPRFEGPTAPYWPLVDEVLTGWVGTIAWGAAYTAFYAVFATEWWMFLFVPVHYLLGPIHGAIVNYFGHKVGYTNFDNGDNSKNTLVFDVLTMGELFQNNHHKFAMSPNFGGARWFEIDPTYQFIRVFAALGIIDTTGSQVMKRRPKKSAPIGVMSPSPMDGE